MSLFSNHNPNRRIKKGGSRRAQNLLEVSARPDGERKGSVWPQIFAALKVVTVIALIGGVCFGGKAAVRRLVWENPMYALSDIRVSTDGLLTRKQVLEIAEIEEGQNIFSVDLNKARKNIDQLPQVDRVELRRLVPDRLDIKIIERQPVAWVAPAADSPLAVGSEAMLVDSRGYVMRSRKIQPEHAALPVIIGVSMEDVAAGQKLPSAEALAAIDLIRLSADDLRWQPRIVDVSKGYCLLVTDHRKAKITFAFDGLEDQLSRLKHLIELVEPSHREFQSVNLMLEKSVPVVFAAPALNAPVEQKKGGGKTAPSKLGAAGVGAGAPNQVAQPPQVIPVTPAVSHSSSGTVGSAGAAVPQSSSAEGVPSGGVLSRPPGISSQRTLGSGVETQQSSSKIGREKADAKDARDVKGEARATVSHAVSKPQITNNAASSSSNSAQSAKPAVRAEKGVSNADRSEKTAVNAVSDRQKSEVAEKKSSSPKQAPQGASPSGSLSPSEALRKLFNPHG
jgi:cell division septal protein FtsQ